MQNWHDLMAQTLAGDQQAYKALLTALRPWLTSFFRQRVPADVVEDLVQETLLTIHTKRHTYDPALPFGPWLVTVAKHRWVDYLRQHSRRQEDALPEDDTLAATEADIAAKIDVETLLALLPENQAKVIQLTKLAGHSIAETAAYTGQSSSAVKVMVHRGLATLKKLAHEKG